MKKRLILPRTIQTASSFPMEQVRAWYFTMCFLVIFPSDLCMLLLSSSLCDVCRQESGAGLLHILQGSWKGQTQRTCTILRAKGFSPYSLCACMWAESKRGDFVWRAKKWVAWFVECFLEERTDCLVNSFAQNGPSTYHTVHGDDAIFIANDYYHTTDALAYLGIHNPFPKAQKFLWFHWESNEKEGWNDGCLARQWQT